MGMSVIISAAKAQDAEQVLKLQYLCFQSEAELYGNYRIDPLVQTLDSVRAEIATNLVFVARLGEEVVGSVRGSADQEGTGQIGRLCVHPGSGGTVSAPVCWAPRRPDWQTSGRPPASGCTPGTGAKAICGSTGARAMPPSATPPVRTASG